MGKQQKNIIALVAALLVLGGLAGVYFRQTSAPPDAGNPDVAAEDEVAESIPLIEREQAEISEAEFVSRVSTVSLAQKPGAAEGEFEWYFPAYPDVPLNQTAAGDMARGGFSLIADKKLADTVADPAEYGLEPAVMKVNVKYTDGTTKEIRVGNRTPDKKRYYLTVEGDPALYLLYTYYGDRYLKSEGDLVDRTLADFSTETYEYVLINEQGKKPVEFAFNGTAEEYASQIENYGMANISMTRPYPGRELYYSNFKVEFLDKIAGLAIGDLIEMSATDFAPYGLDAPVLEFRFINAGVDTHLLFGSRTEDGKIYVKYASRPQVFVTDYASVSTLFDVNPFTFIDKFLALVSIEDCESIDIAHSAIPARNMTLELNRTIVPGEGEEEDARTIAPEINGVSVGEDEFRALYRLLIAFAADADVEIEKPAGEPVFSVSYNLTGGDRITIPFYEYDANFYSVFKDGSDFVFLTNKQSTELFFAEAGKLYP